MLDALAAPYLQRALLEILLLAVPGGLLGSWIVLRRMAFYTHAVGTAAFPGLVVAGPWGIPAPLAALGCALALAGGVNGAAGRGRIDRDAATGLLLVGALAAGVILASDVYESGAGVDRLLFGSLLGVSDADLLISGALAAIAVAVSAAAQRSWLVAGFDPGAAPALGVRPGRADVLLLAVVALAVVAALDAVGALLVASIFVLPAATVRLVARRLWTLQAGSVALAAAQGVAGLWLAQALDVGPGPAIAVLGGATFALVAAATR